MSDIETSLTLAQGQSLSYKDMYKLGEAFIASEMFGGDMNKISKAITKIQAGQELGVPPFAAMRGIHVIEGSPELSANIIASKVKGSPKYDYEVVEKSETGCKIRFVELRGGDRVTLGEESFDVARAKMQELIDPSCDGYPAEHNVRSIQRKGRNGTYTKQGCYCKDNWRRSPEAMFFARALSNGARAYCPDVFNGISVYAPGEISESREVIDSVVVEPEKPKQPASAQAETPTSADEAVQPIHSMKLEEQEAEAMKTVARKPIPKKPQSIVTEDTKAETTEKLDAIGLSPLGRNRFLNDTVGTLTTSNLTDNQWMKLNTRVDAVLNKEEDLPEEWMLQAPPVDGKAQAAGEAA